MADPVRLHHRPDGRGHLPIITHPTAHINSSLNKSKFTTLHLKRQSPRRAYGEQRQTPPPLSLTLTALRTKNKAGLLLVLLKPLPPNSSRTTSTLPLLFLWLRLSLLLLLLIITTESLLVL